MGAAGNRLEFPTFNGVDVLAIRSRATAALPFSNIHERLHEYLRDDPVHEGDVIAELGGGPSMAAVAANLNTAPVFSVFRYADVVEVLRDTGTYSSTVYEPTLGAFMGRNFFMMGPPEHGLYRKVLRSAFTKRGIEGMKDRILRPVIEREVEAIMEVGRSVDLLHDFAERFPVDVVHYICGLQPLHRGEFHVLAVSLLLGSSHPELARAASARLRELLHEAVDQHRHGSTGDDLVSLLISAEVDGRPLTDDEILPILSVLLPAGGDTTARLTATVLHCLLDDPALLCAVIDDRVLLAGVIDEALRWEPPTVFIHRVTTCDTQLANVAVPKGAGIVVCLSSANRDPEIYDEPHRFDPSRRQEHAMAFGFGSHLCVGMHLGRGEAEQAVTALVGRAPRLRRDDTAEQPNMVGLTFRQPNAVPALLH